MITYIRNILTETCGADRIIIVEEKVQPKRLAQEAFVTKVDGQPIGEGQHFVGVGMNPDTLRMFIKRCKRCAGCSASRCDINTMTFQHPEPQSR